MTVDWSYANPWVKEVRDLLLVSEHAYLKSVEERYQDPRGMQWSATALVDLPMSKASWLAQSLQDERSLADYPPHTRKLIPGSWFKEMYGTDLGMLLYENIHLGRCGKTLAILRWMDEGFPVDRSIWYHLKTVVYEVALNASMQPALVLRKDHPRCPAGEIVQRGDGVVESPGKFDPRALLCRREKSWTTNTGS